MDYLRVLYRRRWIVAVIVLLTVGGIAVYDRMATPMYRAQVTVLIEPDTPRVVNFQDVLNEGLTMDGYFQTQIQMLKSRAVAERTAAVLAHEKRAGFDHLTTVRGADRVLYGLDVVPVRGTRMVSIRYTSANPAEAAEIANAHARAYIQQGLDSRLRASKEATDWLDSQLAEERQKVEEREKALQVYREQHDAVSLTAGQNIVVQKLADLNAAVTRAKTDRLEKEAQYREWLAIRKAGSLDAIPAVLSNPFIQQLKGDLARLQQEYSELAESLGDRHPTLVAKRAEIDTSQRRLAAEVDRVIVSQRNAYQAAQAQENSLVTALEQQKAEALAQNRRGIEYAALEREADSERVVYQNLLQRAKETGVTEDLRVTNIRTVDSAMVPRQPVSPRPVYDVLLGLCGGLFLAVGAVFVVELVDDRIKTPADVTAQLEQTCLGLLPEVRGRSRRVSLLHEDAPAGLVEGFRMLRTTMLSAAPARSAMSILIASTTEKEGKTHVASNLAISLAQSQRRVLLVDADLRRPNAHVHFGTSLEPGLSNLLTGQATLRDAVRTDVIPGLSILPAGGAIAGAPELLGTSVFTDLLDVLEEHFSCVIIDSPPTLAVSDALLIAQRVSGVVFVVGSEMTHGRAARLALTQLQQGGGTVLGTVLNRAHVEQHPFYFSPYTSSGYHDVLPEPLSTRQ